MSDVVVGIDGGGTHTRAVVAGLGGEIRGVAERSGASSEHNDPRDARRALRDGVQAALADADRDPTDVVALTAGVAGLDEAVDYAEAEAALDVDWLPPTPRVVNDAGVAHVGALIGDPGIVAVAGTGSIVLGVTAAGEQIRNYDCNHYARIAARHLGERALHAMLANDAPADWPVGARLRERWDCDSRADLGRAVREDDRFDTATSGNALDAAAPIVTGAAADGDETAQALCDDAVREMETGIRCVAGFLDPPVSVAPVGSVLRSEYVRSAVERRFDGDGACRVVSPALSPVAGAAYDAIDRATGADEAVVSRLGEHPVART